MVQLATLDGSSSRASGWGTQITGLVSTVISAAISGLAGATWEHLESITILKNFNTMQLYISYICLI